jgi:hypothetical protein
MGWNDGFIDMNKEVERLIQQFFRLKFDLIIIHFSTKIAGPCRIGWNKVDLQFSTLFILPNNWK